MTAATMARYEHAERLLKYRLQQLTRKTRAPPHPCPSRRPHFPHRTSQLRWPHAVAVEKEKAAVNRPRPSSPSSSTAPRAQIMDGVVVHNDNIITMAPEDGGEDEVAITRVTMVTTTVVQIENRRKRGRSPQVKVKTKSDTETTNVSRVVVVGPIRDWPLD